MEPTRLADDLATAERIVANDKEALRQCDEMGTPCESLRIAAAKREAELNEMRKIAQG